MFVKKIKNNFFENFRKATEMGRQFPKSDTSPPLNIEATIAIFISSGKTPVCIEILYNVKVYLKYQNTVL